MKKIYEQHLENKKEEREVRYGKEDVLKIQYEHYPNEVGPRSMYTGLPIWVGKTIASAIKNGGTTMEVEAKCWMDEPFDYDQARFIVTGRLLKAFKLPTSLAEQVKD